jgi:hypothetical protein
VPIVLKSGSLNLLQPSGHVQACNGTALHLPNNTAGETVLHKTEGVRNVETDSSSSQLMPHLFPYRIPQKEFISNFVIILYTNN